MIYTINYFRKICFVIDFINNNNKFVISFQAFIERFYNYQTFRRIDQKNKYQIIKSTTSYKKFDDYKTSNVLIDYKKNIFIELLSKKTKLNDVSTLNNITISLLDQLKKILLKSSRFLNFNFNQCQHQHNRFFQSIKSINFSTICQFY